MMSETMETERLARYLSGTASPEERVAVEARARANPAYARELEQLKIIWKAPAAGQWDVDRAWARVANRLDQTQTAKPLRPRLWTQTWARAAAVAVLVLGAGLLWRSQVADAPRAEVVATLPGEQETLDLPDGTRITVAPGSRLTVAADYGQRDRRVDLEGEAWFEVIHDETLPFRVFAAGTMTEDLGTEFGVRAYNDEATVRLVVLSGSASLRRSGASDSAAATLEANDMATLAAADALPVVTRGVNVAGLVSWRNGEIMLENSRLDSVVVELGRWYGLTFRLAEPGLGSRRLSATLRVDDLAGTLDILGLSLGLVVEQEGDTVTLGAGGR